SENGEFRSRLENDPRYRLVHQATEYYRAYELRDATPAYGWDGGDSASSASALQWEPELRVMRVSSIAGGKFRLSEDLFPGWRAKVDGVGTRIEACKIAFACVAVPAGTHLV